MEICLDIRLLGGKVFKVVITIRLGSKLFFDRPGPDGEVGTPPSPAKHTRFLQNRIMCEKHPILIVNRF